MSYSNSCYYCFFQAHYFTFHKFSPCHPCLSLKCLSVCHCAFFILSPLIWFVFCYHCVSFDLKVLKFIHPTKLYTASLHNLYSFYLRFWYYLWCFSKQYTFPIIILSSLNLQTCLKILTWYCYITSTLCSYLIADLSISNFLHCLFTYW
jgi:hypothetical protein